MRIHPSQKQVQAQDNGPGIGNDLEKTNKNRQIEKQTRKTIKNIVYLNLQFPIETSAKQVQAENFAPSVENDLHRTNRTRTWKAEFGRKQVYQSCFRLSSCYFNDDIEVTEQEREKNNSM